jgi:hypothetical protein
MGYAPLSEKEVGRIIYLREHGHSLPEIQRLTRHGQGTIFRYIKDVKILPRFQDFWRNKQRSSVARMIEARSVAAKQAKSIVGKLTKKEKILIATCLYWAEGAKRDFSLSNTDPVLIKTFAECIKELGVGKESFSLNLRVFEDLNKGKARDYWSRLVGIPKDKIVYIDIRKGRKNGKLPYGMCRLRVVKGGFFLKLFSAIVKEIEIQLK